MSDFQLECITIGIKCLYFKNVIGSFLKVRRFKCKPVFEHEDLEHTFVTSPFNIGSSAVGDHNDFLFNMVCDLHRLICVYSNYFTLVNYLCKISLLSGFLLPNCFFFSYLNACILDFSKHFKTQGLCRTCSKLIGTLFFLNTLVYINGIG